MKPKWCPTAVGQSPRSHDDWTEAKSPSEFHCYGEGRFAQSATSLQASVMELSLARLDGVQLQLPLVGTHSLAAFAFHPGASEQQRAVRLPRGCMTAPYVCSKCQHVLHDMQRSSHSQNQRQARRMLGAQTTSFHSRIVALHCVVRREGVRTRPKKTEICALPPTHPCTQRRGIACEFCRRDFSPRASARYPS